MRPLLRIFGINPIFARIFMLTEYYRYWSFIGLLLGYYWVVIGLFRSTGCSH